MLFLMLRQQFGIHPLEDSWGVTAEVVLEAIQRAPDLTQRMFRGILAEAAFKVEVVDKLDGWVQLPAPSSSAFDFQIQQNDQVCSIQVKLQRKLSGAPMRAPQSGFKKTNQYVVELQKTRSGVDAQGNSTRPYRFGEFDILAVSVEPVTSNWASFRYTCSRWLIPRPEDHSLIAVFQPVSLEPDEDWTDDLGQCIDWHFSGVMKTIAGERVEKKGRRRRKGDGGE